MISLEYGRNSSLNYIDFLHSDAINDSNYKRTYVFLGVRKSDSKAIYPVPVRVEEILNGSYLKKYEFNRNCDYYISSNVFKRHGEKSRAMLFSLENIIIDVDNHTSNVDDMQIEYLINRVMSKVAFNPTGVNKTGRGVQFIYQIDKVSFKLEWLIRAITESLINEIQGIISQDTNLRNFEVDSSASKNTAGFFRLAGTVNTKVGKLATFQRYGKKYNHQELVDYYHKDIFGKISNNVNKRKNKSVSTPTTSKKINNSSLFNTRLNWVYDKINICQSNGEYTGFRDKCLFLAGNCFYFQNSSTFRERLEQLNNGLMYPLDINLVRNIEDTIEKAHGYRYKNESFLMTLGYSYEETTQIKKSSNKRLQGQEHTKQINERNKRIIADFLAEIDVNPKDLTLRLARKYEMSKSQINRIVKDVRKQHKLDKVKRVVNLRQNGKLLREVALQEARSVATIHRLEKLYQSIDDDIHFQKTRTCFVCLGDDVRSSFVGCEFNYSNQDVFNQEIYSFDVVDDEFVCNEDSVPFDVSCISLLDGFIDEFNTGHYSCLNRFLNDDDICVLRVFYSYFANQKLVNSKVDDSNSVYLSISKLHYLCLPDTRFYGSKFDSISLVRKAIFDKYYTSCFTEPNDEFIAYLNRYVSDLGQQYHRIRISLRKLIYLGLISINDDFNSRRYHCMSLSPTSLDVKSADGLACEWYQNGYSLKYICYDDYIKSQAMNSSITLVSSSRVLSYDVHDLEIINDLISGLDYFPLSKLSKKQRDIVEVFIDKIGDGSYRVVKVKDKSMLKSLGISGVKVGSKVLVHLEV